MNLAEVEEYMSEALISVHEDASVKSMLDALADSKVSALPVVGSQGNCVGIVSLTDIVRRVLETEELLDNSYPHFDDCLWAVDLIQRRFGSETVSKIMTEVVTTVSPDTPMQEAAKRMLNNHVHHLPVVSAHGKLLGMLSTVDFVRLSAA